MRAYKIGIKGKVKRLRLGGRKSILKLKWERYRVLYAIKRFLKLGGVKIGIKKGNSPTIEVEISNSG